jgi:hypothetical protein
MMLPPACGVAACSLPRDAGGVKDGATSDPELLE